MDDGRGSVGREVGVGVIQASVGGWQETRSDVTRQTAARQQQVRMTNTASKMIRLRLVSFTGLP